MRGGLLLLVGGLVAFLTVPTACEGGWNPVEARVLVVESYGAQNVMYEGREELQREVLLDQGIRPEVRTIYLDCERYGLVEEMKRMNYLLDSVSQGWRPELILVNDDQATYSLLVTGHALARTVPVVFGGVNFPNEELIKRCRNVTGLIDRIAVWENVELLKGLFGGEYTPYTLMDSNFLDKRVMEVIAQERELHPELLFNWVDEEASAELLVTGKLDLTNSMVLEGYSMRHYRAQQAMRQRVLRKSYLQLKRDLTTEGVGLLSVNPSLTAINEGFGTGERLLGGYFTPLELQLKEQAQLAKEILTGTPVGQLPVRESEKQYVLDWRVWQVLGLDKAKVPGYVEWAYKPNYVLLSDRQYALWAVGLTLLTLILLGLLISLKRERNRKREALRDLEAEKEMLALAVRGSGMYAWYMVEGVFRIDAQFWELMGLQRGDISLKEWVGYVEPEARHGALLALGSLNVASNQQLEVRCNFDGKGYRWWEFRFTTMRRKGKLCTMGLLLDIEKQKHYEEEMTRAREMAEKSELKQSFLTNISHEIRTPLNAIVGFTNILYSGEELEPEERDLCIESINLNTGLLLGLVGDVLDLSRFESGQMEMKPTQCNVHELMEEIYRTNRVLMPAYLEFELENIALEAFVKVDRGRFTQVINNFLTNAMKFTTNGYIKLGCSLDEETQLVSFYVEDSGQGISKEEQQMIFTRFYKHDEFAQGTGIGLSICQMIVEKLDGRLELWSEPGKGSRFSVKLPYWRILTDKELRASFS